MASTIWTEELSREFKSGKEKILALNDVSIAIEPQKLTILRGRSGSGKTTLINMLGALDRPTKGRVFLDGREISGLSDKNQDELRKNELGFVFQSFALISLMTAYENVEFPLRLLKMKPSDRKARIEECLTLVGLHKRMNHLPAELSGGEQQRVAIARAMAHRPKIILADEPTAELDSHMSAQVMKVFRDLVDKEKVTVVMTTHDPNVIELGDVVFTLEDGRVIDQVRT